MTTDELNEIFGANVRRFRSHLKMTQRQLAEKLNVYTPYISEIENGKRSPLFATIARFAEALGTTPDVLLKK